MKIYEYRIVFPLTVERFRIAKIYTMDQKLREESESTPNDYEELVANESYQTETESGQYIHTIIRNKSRVPAFLRLVVPEKYFTIHHKRWNAYPHERTTMINSGMGDNFLMSVEWLHLQYRPNEPFPENLAGLSPEQLARRKVIWVDIVDSKPQPDKKEESLRNFVCPEAGIMTPLTGSKKAKAVDESVPPVWTQKYPGEMMCAVNVTIFKFKWRGLQSMVEKQMMAMNRTIILQSGRRLMTWASEWCRLSVEEAIEIDARQYAQFRPREAGAHDDDEDGLIPELQANAGIEEEDDTTNEQEQEDND
jgi:hypothetical protein